MVGSFVAFSETSLFSRGSIIFSEMPSFLIEKAWRYRMVKSDIWMF